MLSSDKKNNRQLAPGLKANTWNLGQGICLLMRCLITRLYWEFWRSHVSHVTVTCSDFYLSRESRTAYIYTGYVVLIIFTQIIVEGSIWHVVVCLSVRPTRSNTGSTRSRLYTGANGTAEQQNKSQNSWSAWLTNNSKQIHHIEYRVLICLARHRIYGPIDAIFQLSVKSGLMHNPILFHFFNKIIWDNNIAKITGG